MKSRFEDAPRERDRDSRDAPRDSSPKRRKTRGTRWGSESQKVNYPGLPTALPPNLTAAQQDSYVIHLRVEELGRTFRIVALTKAWERTFPGKKDPCRQNPPTTLRDSETTPELLDMRQRSTSRKWHLSSLDCAPFLVTTYSNQGKFK